MNEEFYRRQTEINQEQEHQKIAQEKHPTLETYNLEQQEAHAGHIPQGADVEPPAPSLWQRIKTLLKL